MYCTYILGNNISQSFTYYAKGTSLLSRAWITGGWRQRAWRRLTELQPCLGTTMVTASSQPESRYSSGAMTIPPRPPPQVPLFTSGTLRRRGGALRTSAGTACGRRAQRTPWRTLRSPQMGPFSRRPLRMIDLSEFGIRTSNVSHWGIVYVVLCLIR